MKIGIGMSLANPPVRGGTGSAIPYLITINGYVLTINGYAITI